MKKISMLMYHQIGEFSRPDAHRANYCHVRRFRGQMAFLHHCGYRVIGLQQALNGLFGSAPLPTHSVVLTFDDGYRNFLTHALPVLERYRFPATLFVVSGLLGKPANWLHGTGRQVPRLLDPEALGRLASRGIAIGAHTRSHSRLPALDDRRLDEEILGCKTDLETLLDAEVPFFCYPFGEFDERTVAAARRAGFRAGLTCIRGSATREDDPLLLPRKAVSYGDSLLGFLWKLHMKHRKKEVPPAGDGRISPPAGGR